MRTVGLGITLVINPILPPWLYLARVPHLRNGSRKEPPRRAERLAGLSKLKGAVWHPYRRRWATIRKYLPLTDVAAAGGWKSTQTLLKCYQQPDGATMLEVVLGGAELREKGRA